MCAKRHGDMMPAARLTGVFAFVVSAAPPWPISGHDLALALLPEVVLAALLGNGLLLLRGMAPAAP